MYVSIRSRGPFGSSRKFLADCGFGLVEGVVRRADERAGFDVLETDLLAENFEFGKLVGMDVANDWQMVTRRLEVLAQGKNVCALRGEFCHGGQHFVFFFA